jgi:hypothetical protein
MGSAGHANPVQEQRLEAEDNALSGSDQISESTIVFKNGCGANGGAISLINKGNLCDFSHIKGAADGVC